MRRELLRDAALIAVIAIVIGFASLTALRRADECSTRRGTFEVHGQGRFSLEFHCHLPDGSTIRF